MKKLLKKIFYWDAPAHGALFATVLFLPGSWILFSLAVLFGGISADCPGLFPQCGSIVWKTFGILELLLFLFLLICGAHFGKLYLKDLCFARRWKWQIPATGCWFLQIFPVLQVFNLYLILNHTASLEPLCRFSQIMSGKWMIGLSCAGFFAMFAGIFFTAKIIETSAQTPWKKLFGKGSLSVLILFVIIVPYICLKLIPGAL